MTQDVHRLDSRKSFLIRVIRVQYTNLPQILSLTHAHIDQRRISAYCQRTESQSRDRSISHSDSEAAFFLTRFPNAIPWL